MRNPRLHAVLCAALLLGASATFDARAQKADAVRPEVGKPLQEAQSLSKSGKHREAMAKVNEADAAGNKTANESFLIQRMRGSVASAAGDVDSANKAFEAVLNSGKVTGRDALSMEQAIAVNHYKAKDYGKAAQWTQRYFKDGGTDPAMRTVLLQSYYLGNDCGNVNKMLGSAAEDSSRRASEEELQILANCYLRQRDTGGYVNAIEKLVVLYPKKEYWTDLLSRVQKKPGFSDRLGVHVYRLRLATGNVASTNDYLEMAQLALQAGVPAEAKAIVDKGYDVKALGTGKEAERHQRLRDLVQKDLAASQRSRAKDEQDALAAKDGNDLVKLGLNYVYEGNADKGLALIEQGIKKGGLKRPDDAKLRLGEAQLYAGHKAKGVQTLKDVKGSDGTADIARLWILSTRA
jgi:outer membrane protein assembly factor BamD (BamD/ComL family)